MSWYVTCTAKRIATLSPLIRAQVEVTGSTAVANLAINYVRRNGTLLLYSVYDSKGLVNWSPSKIFTDEIKVCHDE